MQVGRLITDIIKESPIKPNGSLFGYQFPDDKGKWFAGFIENFNPLGHRFHSDAHIKFLQEFIKKFVPITKHRFIIAVECVTS